MKFSCIRAAAFIIISASFLLVAAGCKKSSSSNGGGSGSMSATVSGTAWANNFPTVGVYANTNPGGLFEIIGLQFKSGDSTGFELEFVSPITLNLAVSTDTSALIVAYTDSKTQATYGALPGIGNAILTVTAYDSTGHTIAGTFSGSLYNASNFSDSIVVTNGKFNSAFTVQ